MEEGTSLLKILTRKPAGKKPLGRRRRRWEDYFRMHLKEIGSNTRNWTDSLRIEDYRKTLVNPALNLRVS